MNSLKNFISSDEDNIYQIIKILGNNSAKINPNYFSKMCGTTGLIVFFVKDILDYLGISSDKKTIPQRTIKSFQLAIRSIENKLKRLKCLLDKSYIIS